MILISKVGEAAGRGAKLKIEAETNTIAKMTRLGVCRPPPVLLFSLVIPPTLPLSLPLILFGLLSLSFCQHAPLYCYPAYLFFLLPTKTSVGVCVCVFCEHPGWACSTWLHEITQGECVCAKGFVFFYESNNSREEQQ